MTLLRAVLLVTTLAAAAALPSVSRAETCANARAIDGDTIRCANGRKIRLKDAYAPEMNQRGGQAAKDRLGSAANGKTFSYKPEGNSYRGEGQKGPLWCSGHAWLAERSASRCEFVLGA